MHTASLLTGVAAGSALMFMLDPERGRRRRAMTGDQVVRLTRVTRRTLDATARDVANRAGGMVASTRGRLARESPNDTTLVERVRARLGRVCTHPRAVDVEAHDGHVTLRGHVLASELDSLIAMIRAVRGVSDVSHQLDVHDTSAGIPSLQGGGHLPVTSVGVLQRRWSPATRAMVTAGVLATGAWMMARAARGNGSELHDAAL